MTTAKSAPTVAADLSGPAPAYERVLRFTGVAREWAGRLSHPFAFAGMATLLFALIAVILSALTGAPLTVPTERMSLAAGVHYLVPFGTGVLGYGLIQAIRLQFDARRADKHIWQNIWTDAYFLILFVAVMYFHFHIKMWMPIINPALFDQAYFNVDRRFSFIIDAFVAMRRSLAPLIPAVDDWYQVGFFLLFMMALCVHAITDRRYHYHSLIAILLMEILGALSYLIAPAVGPFIYEQGVNLQATAAQTAMYDMFTQVQQFGTAWLIDNGGQYFTGPPAAMPSLHVAVSYVIVYYAFKARLVVLPLMLMLLFWFVIESVASRWHYLVDLPAGLALATVVILLTNRICRRLERVGSPTSPSLAA